MAKKRAMVALADKLEEERYGWVMAQLSRETTVEDDLALLIFLIQKALER